MKIRADIRKWTSPWVLRGISWVLVLLLAWHFRRVLSQAWLAAGQLGWKFLWLLPLFAAWNALATGGWQALMRVTTGKGHFSFWRLFVIRVEGQALNILLPSAGLGGEWLRASKTAVEGSPQASVSAVVLDKLSATVAEVFFVLLGLGLAVRALPQADVAIGLSLFVLVGLLGLLFAWPQCLAWMMRVDWLKQRLAGAAPLISKDNPGPRRAAYRAVFWHLGERLLMAVEIAFLAHGMGLEFGLSHALVAMAVATAFGLLMFFIPGQVGAYEGGMAYGFVLLGLSPKLGLAVALLRRARQLVICVIGLGLLFTESSLRSKEKRQARAVGTVSRIPKIMYILPSEGFGGAERQGSLHMSLLKGYGLDVLPVVGPGEKILDALKQRGVLHPYHCASMPREYGRPYSPLAHSRYLFDTVKAWRKTYQELLALGQREGVDLIFASRTVGWTLAGPLAKSLGIPCVWRAGSRAQGWAQHLALAVLGFVMKPDLLVANCQSVADSVAPSLGVAAQGLPNGVDIRRFSPSVKAAPLLKRLALPRGTILCGLAARPSPDKGMDFLASVIQTVTATRSKVHFVVAGEFGWRNQIQAFFDQRGLGSHISFLGHVEDIPAFYAACKVVMLTSRQRSIEGSPNALLEAMATQRPVVATAVGGITELIRHGENGLLAPADQAEQFARHLLDILDKPQLAQKLARAGRRYIVAHHAEGVVTRSLSEILNGVLQSKALVSKRAMSKEQSNVSVVAV